MKRPKSVLTAAPIFVEALEPRIAPAGLLNESKFTSVTLGTPQLLDASGGPNDFQGLTTGSGANGAYLLYITSGKALVFTSDLNGNGRFDPGEITGIAAGVDSEGRPLNLTLFSDVHGDIVTDLLPGHGVSQLSDSDNNPANGRDGRVLLSDGIAGITIRTLTSGDIDTTIPGNTLQNRLGLTSFSIYGNIYSGGDFGGLKIDTSGAGALAAKFTGGSGTQLFTGATPEIGDIYTGTAANNQPFHFTQLSANNAIEGSIVPFTPAAGVHGGDILGVQAAQPGTVFSVGTLATGNGGFNARGGNISGVTLDGDNGGYQLIAGDGGEGPTGAVGGSIINFSDLGTISGEVLLHSGAGGVGLLGAGGAGGTVTLGAVNVASGVDILLGHGGNGFTAGGAGAGLPTATFTAPEGTIPLGSQFLGTYHLVGDIGNTHLNADGTYSPDVIDFNGDGIGDGVFTTSNPNQIVVVFGDGVDSLVDASGNPNTNLPSETIRLHAPGLTVGAVTVGDFNGDGKLDIAAVSNDPNNFGGVYVFLNQIGDSVHNPLGAQNFSTNPLGAHPFSTPMQSAMPSLVDFGYFIGPSPVTALVAGDFNGDGITDLAYVANVTELAGLNVNPVDQVVGVLFGSAARDPNTGAVLTSPTTGHPEGTGYFFANPAAQAQATLLQVAFFSGTGVPVLKASSLTATNVPMGSTTGVPTTPESIFFGNEGSNKINLLQTDTFFPELIATGISLGKVDTNRSALFSFENADLQDFTLQDINQDGNADIAVVTKTPVEFIVTLAGDGVGDFTIKTGDAVNQAGIFVGSGKLTAITAIDGSTDPNFATSGTGFFSDIGALEIVAGGAQVTDFSLVQAGAGNRPAFDGLDAATQYGTIGFDVGTSLTIHGFDAFYQQAPSAANLHPATGFGALSPNTTLINDSYLNIIPNTTLGFFDFVFETNNGFRVYGGDGGNALIGGGGVGGSIGNGLLAAGTAGVSGSVGITFPAYESYFGSSFLSAGKGGNGFTTGGIGGDISGISVAYTAATSVETSGVQIVAGDGGNGVSGAGGRGGVISQFSVASGTQFSAGNGGAGAIGGAGGSVLGNNQGVFDTSTVQVSVVTGSGGTGATGGGAGGSISNFDAVFLPVVGGVGGSLSYLTGPGGNAAGGIGGAGGSITNSSPDSTTNNLSGDITLYTGSGGSGLTGGAGGAITNFINQSTSGDVVPSRLNVIAGNGGIGISGTGGAGGTITNFQSNATGLQSGIFEALSGTVRILAGQGGNSFATTGGAGGSILNSTALSTSSPIVVAAGAGGDAPLMGGVGGSVLNSVVSSAAQEFGKVLVIAGAGGDATGVSAAGVIIPGDSNTTDLAHALLAIGGADGMGGNGGNISNFTQPTGSATAVDLIAGNGGSTINAGTPLDPTTGVGVGGSVTNVNLTGTVGSITRDLVAGSNPPIQAYQVADPVTGVVANTDALGVAGFVQEAFSGTVTLSHTSDTDHSFVPNNPFFALDDAAGNVGIVAGRAGQVKGGQGAQDGVNGSVESVTAGSILSIIAGSVNSVAPVQVLSGITVTNPDGVLGADKSLPGSATAGGPNGVLDYYNPNLAADVQNLEAGDQLIDGALFAITINQPATAPFIAGPRVFTTVNNGG